MFKRFLVYLPVWFVGTYILPWPLVPIAVLLADEHGRLPPGFRWLETHDDLGYGALDQEPAVEKFADRFGKKAGLIRWLWRNKAYTLRRDMGADITEAYSWGIIKERGTRGRVKWGPSWFYQEVAINDTRYFEFRPNFGFGLFNLYMRIGWKVGGMKPTTTKLQGSFGIFTGITPRIDDFDD